MKVSTRVRILTRMHRLIFILLVISIAVLSAWLSTRYQYQADWTNNSRYTLSATSQQILAQLPHTLAVTVYVTDTQSYPVYQEFFERYQHYKANLSLDFINLHSILSEARQRRLQDGEIELAYQGRTERVMQLNEQTLASALVRLSKAQQAKIVFVTGHGERSPMRSDESDLMDWSREIISRGFDVQTLNFAQTPEIPAHTQVLVLASPQQTLASGAVQLITDYIAKGGNLLWLQEPDALHGLDPLAEQLGVEMMPGIIIDPVSYQLRGDATLASVTQYGIHPVTQGLETAITAFPEAAGLLVSPPEEWERINLLATHNQVWAESGSLSEQVTFDESEDIEGPFEIGVALSRTIPVTEDDSSADVAINDLASAAQQQRIIIVGDGDFLSNAFLYPLNNLELGMRMLHWLAEQDAFIEIPTRLPSDAQLQLSNQTAIFIFSFFVLLLPLTLLSTAIYIWWKR